MPAKLISDTGEALYGAEWRPQLARALDVASVTMQQWISGEILPPDNVMTALLRLTQERIRVLIDLEARILARQDET